MNKSLCVGDCPVSAQAGAVTGQAVVLEGESFYQIANYDQMRPFFMTLVSSSDLWMFISSTGAVTAGRGNPDQALFPYYTDDKLHDAAENTGSKTILIVQEADHRRLWEPFSDRYRGLYRVQRNLYKNAWGNQLVFEEANEDLGLTFSYGWCSSDRFGWVRRSWLSSARAKGVRVSVLDGLQNLMPWGIGSQFQLEKSTLLDAYKRSELVPETGLGLFRLSSIPIDRPEPAEALRATTVWSVGLPRSRKLLSSRQLDAFRAGLPVRQELDIRGERGAYFIQAELTVRPGQRSEWLLAADLGQGHAAIVALEQQLRQSARLQTQVRQDVSAGTEALRKIIACADGIQKTAIPICDTRHAHNVLFNVMRGGIFDDGYRVDPVDLLAFVRNANRQVAADHAAFFRDLKTGLTYSELIQLAIQRGDLQLERLCREYLPLTFSRRHGDPSRPWNRFSIVTRNPDGSQRRYYEGNWRDIFQNWEALALSFPGYVSGMICRFLSASTADGYNPYRITSDGIDWEVTNPADPWSHIGYWGDHQLIYLLKLLELLQAHEPATLQTFLTRELFAYANVPYRIHPYEQLLRNPKETVAFDPAADAQVRARVQEVGSDGRLIWNEDAEVRLVNLTEKLLVTILAKLSNFVPEAGIWMNTQRPEWNDANNALVGNGVSMVTLCYLRRYLAFSRDLFGWTPAKEVSISSDVLQLLQRVNGALKRHHGCLAGPISNTARRGVLDALGRAATQYRQALYARGLSTARRIVPRSTLLEFLTRALEWVDQSIEANRRPDGLYHSYNLLRVEPRAIVIRRLYEMLEGQVAVLSSGRLTAEQSVELLHGLRHSAIYRPDQHSYLLYPNRELPRFLDRNQIPAAEVRHLKLLQTLIHSRDASLVERDVHGRFHFNGSLTNARDVQRVLDRLAASGHSKLVRTDGVAVLALFERLFDHESFTGRSGTFFGYEGLGSIYWHMVSKLLLAVQETFYRALEMESSQAVQQQLAEAYYDIRAGIGDKKSPANYGAFPMDPYSHTPAHAGARQPGLTGQVKEDILCRFGELGVTVRSGQLCFQPALLRSTEFLRKPDQLRYFDVQGISRRLPLPARSLAFTYCQVPIIYRQSTRKSLTVFHSDGTRSESTVLALDAAVSRAIFERKDAVRRVLLQLC